MQRLRVPVVVLGTLALGVCAAGVWYAFDSSSGGGLGDAQAVYCLDPAHEPAVARAGTELGLVRSSWGPFVQVNGAKLALSAWRAQDEAGFDRACEAVAQPVLGGASSDSGGSDLSSTLMAMLQVAFGALLTLAVATRQDVRSSRQKDAAALRESWRAFDAALRDYVEARSDNASTALDPAPMRTAWLALNQSVETLVGTHASWKDATDMRVLLEHELALERIAQWPDPGPDEWEARKQRRTELLGHAVTGTALVERLAGAVTHPLRYAWSR